MEKWVYLFEIDGYQILAKKAYDSEDEIFQIEFISNVNRVEVSVKLSYKYEQDRDTNFANEEKIKDYVETKFKTMLIEL
ncbi:hypothetical protein VB796_06685 [Arcicella sp. LKC2W]|uniref:hypothetical protein n=1 Tax=Arcicella sp. LKC2W TaxID=2984198 RepID=UPI002B2097BA|nr:hypothetical protein [Arcicella sp. LKC2W]MEA5458714.1 hypothetical protein [Arcicella sp. LKC2W]